MLFITPEGDRVPATGRVGQNILDVAHEHDVELEGACEASLACSTCHVILPEKVIMSSLGRRWIVQRLAVCVVSCLMLSCLSYFGLVFQTAP